MTIESNNNVSRKTRLGILISGSGSNLQAILDSIAAGTLDAEVAVVIASKPDAYGLRRAKQAGVPAIGLNAKDCTDADAFNSALLTELQKHQADWVVMAGYMRLLGKSVLNAFPQRVLNLHPALLPAFPGAHAIRDALNANVRITGVTIHIANEVFDEGPIIAQEAVPVLPNDTLETLAERVHTVEHRLYSKVLQLVAENRISVQNNQVIIAPLSSSCVHSCHPASTSVIPGSDPGSLH